MQKNARHYVLKTIPLLENEKNYRNHILRLAKIAGDSKPFTKKQKSLDEHNLRLQVCQDSQNRRNAQEQNRIQRENDRILEKLLTINLQPPKKSSPAKKPPLEEPFHNTQPVGFQLPRTKSMNVVSRKLDILRIVNENVKLTERIVFQESTFSREKMQREYQKSREYSDRIRKFRIKSDKTLEIGHGGIKLSPDLRIKNQIPYLPRLQSTFSASPQPTIYRASSVPKLQGESRSITTSGPAFRAKRNNSDHPAQEGRAQNSFVARPQKGHLRSVSVCNAKSISINPIDTSDTVRVRGFDEAFQSPDDDQQDYEPVVSQDQLLLIEEVDANRRSSKGEVNVKPIQKEFLLGSHRSDEHILVQDDSQKNSAKQEQSSKIEEKSNSEDGEDGDECDDCSLSKETIEQAIQEGSQPSSKNT